MLTTWYHVTGPEASLSWVKESPRVHMPQLMGCQALASPFFPALAWPHRPDLSSLMAFLPPDSTTTQTKRKRKKLCQYTVWAYNELSV